MKYTEFYHEGCDTTFFVKYSIEQHVSDVDYCPSCGKEGRVVKEGVKELDGLIVGKGDITLDD